MQGSSTNRPGGRERRHASLLTEALRSLTRFSARRPRLTLCAVFLSACAAIGLTVACMEFKTQRADLIDPDAPFQKRWVEYTENFGDDSDVVVVVEADDSRTVREVLDRVGSRLEGESDLFSNVLYKIDSGRLRGKGLQYLSPRQLDAGLKRLDAYSPIVRGRWDLTRIDVLFSQLQYQIQSRAGSDDAGVEPLLRHSERLASSIDGYLADRGDFKSPWPDIVPVDQRIRDTASPTIYMLNEDGTMGFLKVLPTKGKTGFDGATASIDRLREIIAETTAEYPTTQIGATGVPVLENDEMRRSQADMLKASLISLAAVGILLVLGFRGVRHPLLGLLMLGVGMAWTFGFTTLAVGHLNILSVSFAVILIGLGIDFAIHYLARYLQLRHEGRMLRPALLETSGGVGAGIITAAITTAFAFFCATFTQFLGVAELGIIAGGGIILCALATFVVLPALVALADGNVEPKRLPTPFKGNLLRSLTARLPVLVLILSLVVVLGVGSQAFKFSRSGATPAVSYDSNLLNLQADGVDSVDLQKRLFQRSKNSILFAVSMADGPQEARSLRRRFEALPTVERVEELASRLPAAPSQQTSRTIAAYRSRLGDLPKSASAVELPEPRVVGRAVESLELVVRNRSDEISRRAAESLDRFLSRFEKLSTRQQGRFFDEYQQRTAQALLAQFHTLAASANPNPLTYDDLPPEWKSRFVSDDGKWLVQIYPKEQIWDAEPLAKFIADVRSVDPGVTGTPLQNHEAAGQIRDSYRTASIYALCIICLILLIDFLDPEHKLLTLLPPLVVVVFAWMLLKTRRVDVDMVFLAASYVGMCLMFAAVIDFENLRDAVLAMLPPLAGGLLMFGALALLNVSLNPANMIVLPLVLGIGVDDGVHVVHDFRAQPAGEYRTSPSTMNAIVLTSLTSMIGFGSMMVAAHRGLYSVGLVLVIGVGGCLFVSLVMLPSILTLVTRRQAEHANGTVRMPPPEERQSGGQQNQKRKAA